MTSITKTCAVSGKEFIITDEDQAMLKQFAVPLPTLCPEERLRRRLATRNEIYVFTRKDSLTGKDIFSMYPEETSFPVIDKEYWWTDEFDPHKYARDFDFSRPFFDQFFEFSNEIPRKNLACNQMTNSDYSNNANNLKNCYLVFNTAHSEDCMNSKHVWFTKDSIDCSYSNNCELCYDCTMCQRCYNTQSSLYSDDCVDSYFLLNCNSCKYCFGCSNLYRKEYHIFNKAYSKEDYEAYMQKLNLSSYSERQAMWEKIWELWYQAPQPHMQTNYVENVSGNYLSEAKDLHNCFQVSKAENMRHCMNVVGAKTSMDYTIFGDNGELIYESAVVGNKAFDIKFSYDCWESVSNIQYSQFCVQSQNLFGCSNLKKAKYCIFNKQYSNEEFQTLQSRIIEHMKETGEYGEYFPIEKASFPYNISEAYTYFPMTKEEVIAKGMSWYDIPEIEDSVDSGEYLDGLPDSSDPLVIKSEKSGKAFRVTSREIDVCKKLKVPLPRMTYDERMMDRMSRLNGSEAV